MNLKFKESSASFFTLNQIISINFRRQANEYHCLELQRNLPPSNHHPFLWSGTVSHERKTNEVDTFSLVYINGWQLLHAKSWLAVAAYMGEILFTLEQAGTNLSLRHKKNLTE